MTSKVDQNWEEVLDTARQAYEHFTDTPEAAEHLSRGPTIHRDAFATLGIDMDDPTVHRAMLALLDLLIDLGMETGDLVTVENCGLLTAILYRGWFMP